MRASRSIAGRISGKLMPKIAIIPVLALVACGEAPRKPKACTDGVWISGVSQWKKVGGNSAAPRSYQATMTLFELERSKLPFQPVAQGDIKSAVYGAIGYNPRDGFLYGVDHRVSEGHVNLYKIHTSGSIAKLGPVAGLSKGREQYVAGDIDNLGYLWVQRKSDNALIQIDVVKNEMKQIVPVAYSSGDIAFHPTTNSLYGYDHNRKALWEYHPELGVREIGLPEKPPRELAGMYFDSFGRLYAYQRTSISEQTLYRFDVATAKMDNLGSVSAGPILGFADAASCPWLPGLEQYQSKDVVSPGDVVQHVYALRNPHPSSPLVGVKLEETLDHGRTFIKGSMKVEPEISLDAGSYGDSGALRISSINVPPGKTVRIYVNVQIPRDFSIIEKRLESHAQLLNVPKAWGGPIIAADNPKTVERGDGLFMKVQRPTDVIRVSGRVFEDNGSGNGVPNDGLHNGGEVGIDGVTLAALCNGQRCGRAETNEKGEYEVWIDRSIAKKGTPLVIKQINLSKHYSSGGSVGNSKGMYRLNKDTIQFLVNNDTEYSGLNFADIRANNLTKAPSAHTICGTPAYFPHVFKARSAGKLSFDLAQQVEPKVEGWGTSIYTDSNCNSKLDEGEPLLTKKVAMDVDSATAKPSEYCVVVKIDTPECVPDGSKSTARLNAFFEYDNKKGLKRRSMQINHTSVSSKPAGQSKLEIAHTVRNLTTGAEEATARPCDILEYSVAFRNADSEPMKGLVISDVTPARTYLYETPSCPPEMSNSACEPVIVSGGLGDQAELEWTFAVPIQPGQAELVTYQVQVADPAASCSRRVALMDK